MKSRHLDKYMAEIIEGPDSAVEKLNAASAVLDRRDAERVPLTAGVSYVSDARMGLTRGEGRLEDLSKTGCKIIGPLLMVGTKATLVIDLSDDRPPLCLADVEVTWSDGDAFGVRFPRLNAEDRQRLQELVLRFATFEGRSEDHTAFRLA
jgi:PilZ domain